MRLKHNVTLTSVRYCPVSVDDDDDDDMWLILDVKRWLPWKPCWQKTILDKSQT